MGRAEDIFERIIKENESGIDDFIQTRQFEELFLDFKRSTNNGSGRNLHQNDRENLAKAISGFGNSEGGVIVWGIDCSKDQDYADVAHTKVHLQNPRRFASWLEGAISGCTVPPHSGVRHHYILLQGEDKGFVVSYIPKSNTAPHQTIGKLQYFMRAGSSFLPVPHAVLAGMFGRRPQPEIYNSFTLGPPKFDRISGVLKIGMGLLLVNRGPGIASDLFMNAWIMSVPGETCQILFDKPDLNSWTGNWAFGRHISLISKPEVRLPPRTQLQPLTMHIELAPSFSKALTIDATCGCGQAPLYRFAISKDGPSIEKFYEEISRVAKTRELTDDDHTRMTKNLETWFGQSLSDDPYYEKPSNH